MPACSTSPISDDGPGIDEAEHEQIFSPFYRGHHHHEGHDGGVGLGLFLVKQIARAHQGNVQYKRNAGRSIFTLTLPLS